MNETTPACQNGFLWICLGASGAAMLQSRGLEGSVYRRGRGNLVVIFSLEWTRVTLVVGLIRVNMSPKFLESSLGF